MPSSGPKRLSESGKNGARLSVCSLGQRRAVHGWSSMKDAQGGVTSSAKPAQVRGENSKVVCVHVEASVWLCVTLCACVCSVCMRSVHACTYVYTYSMNNSYSV